MSAGLPFLHWAGSGRPLRVLYIDSEMPPTLMAARAEDATRRLGEEPTGISILPKLLVQYPPLNTRAGQGYMDAMIEKLEADSWSSTTSGICSLATLPSPRRGSRS